MYNGNLPNNIIELPDNFKLYSDEFTPLGKKFWGLVAIKFLEAVARDGKVTPRKIANMRKNFEKLKAEFDAQQKG